MADDGLTALTATEAAAETARGAVSAEEYVRACLDRIEALDGEIKAFVHLDREHALAQARALAAPPRAAAFRPHYRTPATRGIPRPPRARRAGRAPGPATTPPSSPSCAPPARSSSASR